MFGRARAFGDPLTHTLLGLGPHPLGSLFGRGDDRRDLVSSCAGAARSGGLGAHRRMVRPGPQRGRNKRTAATSAAVFPA
jgi:hypothetical protein